MNKVFRYDNANQALEILDALAEQSYTISPGLRELCTASVETPGTIVAFSSTNRVFTWTENADIFKLIDAIECKIVSNRIVPMSEINSPDEHRAVPIIEIYDMTDPHQRSLFTQYVMESGFSVHCPSSSEPFQFAIIDRLDDKVQYITNVAALQAITFGRIAKHATLSLEICHTIAN